ncbi:hypothetical protein Bca4012_072812 [Brassica carinata]
MVAYQEQMFTKRLDAMQPIRKSNPDSYADTPFTDEITLIEMPRKFSFPTIKAYDGSTDPDDHVAQYRQRMLAVALLKGSREATMCKGFGYTQTGPALHWYINLPSRSIASFAVLRDKFVEQFASSRDLEKTSDSLYEILEHQAEPLRGYIARFNQEKVAILECSIPTAISASKRGLLPDGDLYKEETGLSLIVAARKLRPYFLAHPIVVVTSFPVKLVLHKPKVLGRLAKWAVELGEYDIIFLPATAIKSQVLADFVAEFSPALLPALEQDARLRGKTKKEGEWILHVDGSSNVRGAGVGIMLTSPTGNTASRAVRCNFKVTNNESEYEALIAGLTLAHQMGAENIQVFGDSQLIINLVQGEYQAKDDSMIQYLTVAQRLIKKFKSCKLTQIPREQNSQADTLANLGSTLETNSQMSIPLLVLQWPGTLEEPPSEEVSAVEEGETWMNPLVRYLEADILPEDRNEARKIKKQAARSQGLRKNLWVPMWLQGSKDKKESRTPVQPKAHQGHYNFKRTFGFKSAISGSKPLGSNQRSPDLNLRVPTRPQRPNTILERG